MSAVIWTTNVVLLYRAVNSNIYVIIIRYIASCHQCWGTLYHSRRRINNQLVVAV